KASQIAATVRRESTDSANLNSDGAEVRESTEGKGCNRKRAWVQDTFLRTEHGEREEFVQHHRCAEEIADGGAVMPGDADELRVGGEERTENSFEARREPCPMVVNSAENAVGQSDEGKKRDQHSGDVQRQVEAVCGSAGDRAQQILMFFCFFLFFAH